MSWEVAQNSLISDQDGINVHYLWVQPKKNYRPYWAVHRLSFIRVGDAYHFKYTILKIKLIHTTLLRYLLSLERINIHRQYNYRIVSQNAQKNYPSESLQYDSLSGPCNCIFLVFD